jgi:thioredoxin reductase
MKGTSYWIDTAPINTFPALNHDVTVDALIIGAGITGVTTAYLLKKAGLTVALIERDHVAMIDTGQHNGAPHPRDRRAPAKPGREFR